MRFLIALAALVCVAQVKLVEDPPVASAPKAGRITGTISPAGDVVEVYAMYRYVTKKIPADSFDPGTGNFSFNNLPGDASYDIGVTLRGGRTIEGIDLSFTGERFLRLAELRRKQLDMPPEEIQHEFNMNDVKELCKYFQDFKNNDFMDLGRVLYIKGHGHRATMLVELMRDPAREIHYEPPLVPNPKDPDTILRVELWYFLWQRGGWERVANQERVLHRIRQPLSQWQKMSVEYLPAWSVYVDNDGKSPAVKLDVPISFDPTTGRPPRTKPQLESEPNVLGLAEEKK